MNSINTILDFIRSWLPDLNSPTIEVSSRKRRAREELHFAHNPKSRKVLSPMYNNTNPTRSYSDDDIQIVDSKFERNPRTYTNEDLGVGSLLTSKNSRKKFPTPIQSRNLEPRRTYDITSNCFSSTNYRTPELHDISPVVRKTPRLTYRNLVLNSPPTSLDYSIDLEHKKLYNQLLEDVTTNSSFNSSIYGTPMGNSFNLSSRNGKLRSRIDKVEKNVIDLTSDVNEVIERKKKTRLSTKDTITKVLDDFKETEIVIDDSDSDVEILPTPPSPKPDIKVEPINSLRTIVKTVKSAQPEWLEKFDEDHKRNVEEYSRDIDIYFKKVELLSEINKDLKLKKLSRQVEDSLSLKETIFPYTPREVLDENVETQLPQLNDDQTKLVKRAFARANPNEVLTKKFNLHITRADLSTLADLNWLNDNVINFYMNLITERSEAGVHPRAYCMNTFFYQKLMSSGPESLRRWTRKVDIFVNRFICIPIHLGMHWCMCIVDLKKRSIKYYDSMGKANPHCLDAVRGYLEYEHKDKKGGAPFDTSDFLLESVKDIQQQMNGSDCGMFACTFAEYATRSAKFTFEQRHMPYLRKKMVVEIMTGQLLLQ